MLSVGIGIGLQHLGLTGGAGNAALNDGIVLLDSDGNYLLDVDGNLLYAADELFTAGGSAFRTADGAVFGVPA